MLEQDLDTHEDQDHTSGNLCFCLIAQTEDIADLYAGHGENEGRYTDEEDSSDDINLQEGESNTDCQSIDARSDCQQEHRLYIQRVGSVFLFLRQGFLDHRSTDDTEEYEGNPVVNGGDETFKLTAKEIADRRHQCLKAAEP